MSSQHFTIGQDIPQTSMMELELLALERHAAGKKVLELGAEYGASTITMARVASSVVSVDWHQGYDGERISWKQNTLLAFIYNIKEVRDRVIPMIGRFEDVLPLLAPASFDMCFQDGGHGWESTLFAFQQAFRLVRPGGLILTHDYGHPLCDEKAVLDMMGVDVRPVVIGSLAIIDVPL